MLFRRRTCANRSPQPQPQAGPAPPPRPTHMPTAEPVAITVPRRPAAGPAEGPPDRLLPKAGPEPSPSPAGPPKKRRELPIGTLAFLAVVAGGCLIVHHKANAGFALPDRRAGRRGHLADVHRLGGLAAPGRRRGRQRRRRGQPRRAGGRHLHRHPPVERRGPRGGRGRPEAPGRLDDPRRGHDPRQRPPGRRLGPARRRDVGEAARARGVAREAEDDEQPDPGRGGRGAGRGPHHERFDRGQGRRRYTWPSPRRTARSGSRHDQTRSSWLDGSNGPIDFRGSLAAGSSSFHTSKRPGLARPAAVGPGLQGRRQDDQRQDQQRVRPLPRPQLEGPRPGRLGRRRPEGLDQGPLNQRRHPPSGRGQLERPAACSSRISRAAGIGSQAGPRRLFCRATGDLRRREGAAGPARRPGRNCLAGCCF